MDISINEAQISVLSFDNAKNSFLPSSGLAQKPVNESGNNLCNLLKIYTLGGFVVLQVFDKAGQVGYSFSKPLKVKVYLNKNTINPQTRKNIKSDDTIELFSYDDYN